MKITIDIKTDNATFLDNDNEVELILKEIAEEVSMGYREKPITDSNGNIVGKFKVTGK